MITSFEVGAVFKIINEASPALTKILKQVRELNLAIDKAKESLATLSGSFSSIGLGSAVGETEGLAKAWGNVTKNAEEARLAIGRASRTAVRSQAGAAAASAGSGGGGGRGGGRQRLGSWLGGGGAHVTGPGAPLPGGGHVRFGGASMAAVGLLGYAEYQAMEMEKAAYWLTYHAHEQQNETNAAKYRKIIGDAMIDTGFDMNDTAEAATDEIRMFQATPSGGLKTLPTMMRIAAKEALSKGSGLKESMASFVALAHMTGAYTDEDIEKLAPAFAALSTADPRSLTSMTRAAGYAVPLLHSSLDINPMTTLALGTALAGAGALNSKSGTWTREMVTRAMPGTSLMSKMAFKKHEAGLKQLGLVDDHDQPTWFTDGLPDPLKMLDIAGPALAKIPLRDRAGLEKSAFGTQGSEGFAMLSNPAVLSRVHKLVEMMSDPIVMGHYNSLLPDYMKGATVQNARSTLQDFNVTMAELGRTTLPSVNIVLHDFKSTLDAIRGVLPGGDGKGVAPVLARAAEGALGGAVAGAVWGAFGGPIGVGLGAIGGGVIGGVGGVAEQYMQNMPPSAAPNSAAQAADWMGVLGGGRGGHGITLVPGGTPQAVAPITLNLNVDGSRLATAISQGGAFPTQAPVSNGGEVFKSGHDNFSDK
jgi:hypothetical protein